MLKNFSGVIANFLGLMALSNCKNFDQLSIKNVFSQL